MNKAKTPAAHAHSDDRLADFSRDSRLWMLAAMAIVIGAISAPIAFALVWLINAITNLVFFLRFSAAQASPADNHLGPWVILVPAVGGLIIGLMARYGSEKIRGHGIPEALEAILFGRSRMSPKVAVLKPLSSAISIGTGGPFGAEGPIIMTGGAFGSLFAQFFHLSASERKILLVAGAAGGMSAIFSAPIAAVLLAVELLLFEWRPRSFIPVALSAVVSAALRVPLLGPGPIFPIPAHAALGGTELGYAVVVGVIAGLAAGVLTFLVYAFEDLFAKLPIHWMWWPLIGGVCVGVGGWINPAALGVGYETIHTLLQGNLLGAALVSLLVVKATIWSLSLGSGTSGGVLAPLLMIGGALGVLEANWIPVGDRGLWAMISMAAVMGGVMRSPLTAMFFTLELTHDLNVMPGLLLGTTVAYGITVFTLRRSILTEKVAPAGLSPDARVLGRSVHAGAGERRHGAAAAVDSRHHDNRRPRPPPRGPRPRAEPAARVADRRRAKAAGGNHHPRRHSPRDRRQRHDDQRTDRRQSQAGRHDLSGRIDLYGAGQDALE